AQHVVLTAANYRLLRNKNNYSSNYNYSYDKQVASIHLLIYKVGVVHLVLKMSQFMHFLTWN
uniref:hypothetical protein n=1 Tax=Candidatus Ventrenecus sp. TaxID=3085654 RepID=UPI004026E0B6